MKNMAYPYPDIALALSLYMSEENVIRQKIITNTLRSYKTDNAILF
ncbi:MAG: hypothetical protein WBI82_03910 [Sphaerochaeta sp.]